MANGKLLTITVKLSPDQLNMVRGLIAARETAVQQMEKDAGNSGERLALARENHNLAHLARIFAGEV